MNCDEQFFQEIPNIWWTSTVQSQENLNIKSFPLKYIGNNKFYLKTYETYTTLLEILQKFLQNNRNLGEKKYRKSVDTNIRINSNLINSNSMNDIDLNDSNYNSNTISNFLRKVGVFFFTFDILFFRHTFKVVFLKYKLYIK